MLMPRKVAHRKHHRGRTKGMTKGGSGLHFGEFGIQALEPGWLTARQIEAARIAMTRHIKRGGKVWICVFPDKPVTKKPAETPWGAPRQGTRIRVPSQSGTDALRLSYPAMPFHGALTMPSEAPDQARIIPLERSSDMGPQERPVASAS